MGADLKKMVEENPIYIPISIVASFLHVSPAALRASIDQGRCPFGFSWTLGERSGYKVPTITFVAWLTKGIPVEQLTV